MTAAQPAKSNWGNPQDWASIIGGAGQGAAEGFRGAAQQANTKQELKEAKRKTFAELLRNALKRDLSMYRADVGHQDQMTSMSGDAMQQVARGFADSMRGITNRGK